MAHTRRKVAGSVALIAALGSVKAVASPAAPLADADLIRLCGEYVALEVARSAIFEGPNSIEDDDLAEAAAYPLERRMNALLAEMEPIQATSAAGILARADALAAHNGNFGFSFDCPHSGAGRMLAFLLRDAAALAGRA